MICDPIFVHTLALHFVFYYRCTFPCLYRYCLWIVGNGDTLMNSGSVWERLILDAVARGCYHNACEYERLSHAIATAMIELDQVGHLLDMNSLLFRKARWKVCCVKLFLLLYLNY